MSERRFPLPAPVTGAADRDVYSVARLVGEARLLLEREFAEVWLEGEISNLVQAGSGHYYFSMKDATAEVRCALFRNRAELLGATLSDGAKVLVRARVTLYEPRGAFQLIIEHLEDAGEGALRRAFEALKRKLLAEGLFEQAAKKPLPSFPASVGLITSPAGAALRDLLTTFRRRCPAIRLIIYPTSVQGERAPAEIVAAITAAVRRWECDVLILARGGGSLEDLNAFNDERVARAVYECPIPTVCGVGHEIDVTICDLVADQRAATPTAAAELVSPQRDDWLQNLDQLWQRLDRTIRVRLRTEMQRNDELGRRLVHPRERVARGRERLRSVERHLRHVVAARLHRPTMDLVQLRARLQGCSPRPLLRQRGSEITGLSRRICGAAKQTVADRQHSLRSLAAQLNTVSPLATLDRGYAVVTGKETHKIVTSPKDAPVGSEVDVRLAKGGLRCKVNRHRP